MYIYNKPLYSLIIIIFLIARSVYANDYKDFAIGFIDLENDIRYTKWGVHPVDIRSKINLEKRALDGAMLGLKDAQGFERMAKTTFILRKFRAKNLENALEISNNIIKEEIKVLLLDVPTNIFNKITENLINKEIIIFNISNPNNELRNNNCKKNLFHTYPSNQMQTDALAQYLIKKKWNKVLILTGSLEEDLKRTSSFEASAKQFGIRIIDKKYFLLNNNPRAREKNKLSFLTNNKKYNAVFIADMDGEFSLNVPYNTVRPSAVLGASGLKAETWHWSYLRHGAPQVNGRFERKYNRRMTSTDWSGWVAVRSIAEAIVRTKSHKYDLLSKYLVSDDFSLDGSKGTSLSFRKWNRQLRQTILLSTENWVTGVAPLTGFIHSKNNLDTIGVDEKYSTCKEK